MANRDGREALRGGEQETFNLIAEVLTSEQQWAELLKAPLERAARQGNRGLAQKLVRAGAEIARALHAAAWEGHEGIANDLLENGASVDAKDRSRHGNGNTPLHCAAAEGKTETVRLLLHRGADTDAAGILQCTPLYLAARFGNVAAALALMAAGTDVNFRSRMSVVEVAVEYGNMDIVTAAIERGADMDAVDPQNNKTALHVATVANKKEAIDVLVKAGANIQAQDRNG